MRILLALAAALLLGVAFAAGYWMAAHPEAGAGAASGDADLVRRVAAQERQIQIEQSARTSLTAQLRALTDENALLKEDLAFFETVGVGHREGTGGVVINRLRVEPQALPGEYRYRMLLVQGRWRTQGFRGRLELVVDLERDGRPEVRVIPAAGERDGSAYQLDFRLYQRVDGTFTLPAGAVLRRVQVRLFEAGAQTPLSSQVVNLS